MNEIFYNPVGAISELMTKMARDFVPKRYLLEIAVFEDMNGKCVTLSSNDFGEIMVWFMFYSTTYAHTDIHCKLKKLQYYSYEIIMTYTLGETKWRMTL